MPSTDIDGSKIVILSEAEAECVYECLINCVPLPFDALTQRLANKIARDLGLPPLVDKRLHQWIERIDIELQKALIEAGVKCGPQDFVDRTPLYKMFTVQEVDGTQSLRWLDKVHFRPAIEQLVKSVSMYGNKAAQIAIYTTTGNHRGDVVVVMAVSRGRLPDTWISSTAHISTILQPSE